MYLQLVKNIMKSKGFSRADLARMAGVSRAAVTRWFREGEATGWVNVETGTLMPLAKGLGIEPAELLKERTNLKRYETRFLWDHLYPDMESFIKALREYRNVAMARLVQVMGFRDAKLVAGAAVISRFERYKKFVIPARRRQLEIIWPLYRQ